MIVQELVATLGLDVDESSFTFADKVMAVAKGGLLAIGAAAAAAAVGLAAAVAKTAEHADQVQKAAQRTGIGVEALQALQYAAERADVSAEGLQGALNFMAKRGVKDFEAEIRRAADELAAMPDGGEKAARAMKLFGKQGAALIPMLNEGSAGIDKMTTFAREAGIVLGEDMVEEGASLKDALEELQGFVRGLAFTLGGPLLKPAREWLKALGEWIKANRAVIAQRVEKVLTVLGVAFRVAWRAAEPFVRLLGWAANQTWLLVAAAVALGAAMTYQVGAGAIAALGGIGQLIGGVGKLRAAFMALTAAEAMSALLPLVVGAAVIAMLLLVEEVFGWLQGKRSIIGDFQKSLHDLYGETMAVKPDDNPFVVLLKNLGKALDYVQASWAVMKSGGLIAFMAGLQGLTIGPGGMAQMVVANTVKDLAGQGHAKSSTYDPAAWTSAPASAFSGAYGGSPATPTVQAGAPAGGRYLVLNGGVTVNAGPGADGRAVAHDFVDEMNKIWDGRMAAELSSALPAVRGN